MNIYKRETTEDIAPIESNWLETGNYSSKYWKRRTYLGLFSVEEEYIRGVGEAKKANKPTGFK